MPVIDDRLVREWKKVKSMIERLYIVRTGILLVLSMEEEEEWVYTDNTQIFSSLLCSQKSLRVCAYNNGVPVSFTPLYLYDYIDTYNSLKPSN